MKTSTRKITPTRLHRSARLMALACICILLSIWGNRAVAQTPISPTTWGGTTPNAAAGPSAYSPVPASSTPAASAVTVSQWNRGSGVSFNAGANRYNSTSWTVGASTLSTVFASNDYIYFTVTNNATTELKITGVGVGTGQASGTGPNTFGLMYKIGTGAATPFSTSTSAGPSPSFTSTGVVLCAGQTITMYLCGWGGSGAAGTWSINNGAYINASYVTAVTATASATSPVTEPAPVNFTGVGASGITPYTYSWTGPASFASAVASPTIDPSASGNTGTYSLTVTDNWGCTATATTPVVVNSVSCTASPTGVTATPSASALCAGTTLSLTGAATGASSYAWSGPDGFTSTNLNPSAITVSAASSGIYTLVATNACGSTTVTTTAVTVTAVPSAVTATASATTLCSGDALTLTGTATGATSYSWSGPGGYSAIALNPAAITTSTSSAGIYSLTASNTCGSTMATTAAVSINTVPTAVTATASSATLCSGDALTLTGAATGATTFSWVGPDGYTSTNLNPAAITTSTLSAGIYTLTATNSCGNTVATTVSVSINTVPTAVIATPSATTLCSGDALTLTGTAIGATSYSWSGPDSYTAVGTAPAAITTTTLSAGIYTFTATNVCGNTTAFTSAITINTAPTAVVATANPTTLCSGDALTLTGAATSSIATTYAWSGPDGYTSADLNPSTITTTTLSAGVYSLTATNVCGSTIANTAAVTINTVPTAVTATESASTLCAGDALILTGTATSPIATTYAWAGPDGYASTDLNPAYITTSTLSAGIYTLTATNLCGSTVATSGAVVVNTVPLAVSATASAIILCSGNTLTLTGTATSPISTTYAWSGPDVYTSTDLNPSAITTTTSSAGIYTLTATNVCGNTVATTAAVNINTVPTAVTATASASALCSGGALTLAGTATGADTYSWNGPDGYTSTDLNPAAITTSTLSAGTYTLTASNTCGNTVATTAAVIVRQVPQGVTATASPTTLCAGSPLTVDGTSTGATSYSWSGPDGYASASLHPAAFATTTLSAGIYTLTATNICGSTIATTASVTINVVPTSVTATATPTVLCLGNTLTLTGAATSPISTSYTWAGPGGYAAAVLNPAAITVTTSSAGIYTLTATNICGNTIATTASVTILTVPTGVTATSIVGSLCIGATMTLTGTATGASSYNWSGPGGYTAASLNPASTITTSASSGMYTLTATNSCGSTTATATTSVDSPPSVAAIAGASTVCIGSTTTLTDAVPTGVWSSSNATVADVNASGIVSGIATGTATISYNVTNGCGTAMASLAITVLPVFSAAPITGPSIVCMAAPATFTNANAGGTWSSNNTTIATVDAVGEVTGLSVGATILSYTVTNGCGPTITDTLSIVVSTLPDAGMTTGPVRVCQNDTIRMTNSTPNGTWLLTNANAAIAADGLITGLSAGLDTAMYVVANTCGADTAFFTFYVKTVTECATGIGNVASGDINCLIYPNPNNGSFTIKGSLNNTTNDMATVTITNVMGQTVYKNTILLINGMLDHQVILGDNLSNGVYLVNLQSGSINKAIRFTLQKQ